MVVILVSGGYYFIPSVTWILRWLEYLSPAFYNRNALANNQYANQSVNVDGKTSDDILESKNAHGLGLWGSIGALMGLFLLYFITTNLIFIFNLRKHLKKVKGNDYDNKIQITRFRG